MVTRENPTGHRRPTVYWRPPLSLVLVAISVAVIVGLGVAAVSTGVVSL